APPSRRSPRCATARIGILRTSSRAIRWRSASARCRSSTPRSRAPIAARRALNRPRPSRCPRTPRRPEPLALARRLGGLATFLRIARASERVADLAENGGIVDGRGRLVLFAIGDAAHGRTQNLARARLGQALHHHRRLEARYRTDALAHQPHCLLCHLRRRLART